MTGGRKKSERRDRCSSCGGEIFCRGNKRDELGSNALIELVGRHSLTVIEQEQKQPRLRWVSPECVGSFSERRGEERRGGKGGKGARHQRGTEGKSSSPQWNWLRWPQHLVMAAAKTAFWGGTFPPSRPWGRLWARWEDYTSLQPPEGLGFLAVVEKIVRLSLLTVEPHEQRKMEEKEIKLREPFNLALLWWCRSAAAK